MGGLKGILDTGSVTDTLRQWFADNFEKKARERFIDTTFGALINHGDMVYLRTRAFDSDKKFHHYLNAPNGAGNVKTTPNRHNDPGVSDEIWWIEKHSGEGAIHSGDMVYLRTRVYDSDKKSHHYLNAPSGAGNVQTKPNRHPDPGTSDEIWWIVRRR